MKFLRLKFVAAILAAILFLGVSFAEAQNLPVGGGVPLLRLETNGPRSFVSGLAFAPDGKRLYSAGWDKAVLVWDLANDGQFEFNSKATLRTPVGVGDESSMDGALNALALSEDGQWLATAGAGPIRDSAGEREGGWVTEIDDLPMEKKLDTGVIYVFNTVTRQAITLRGHSNHILSIAFVSGTGTKISPPQLVSVAHDVSDEDQRLRSPRLRFWDVKNARELAFLSKVPDLNLNKWDVLPKAELRPGIAAWSTGAQPKQARVAIAWGDNQFRVWDVQSGQVARSISAANTITVLPITARGERIVTAGNEEIGQWSIPLTDKGTLGNLVYKDHFQRSQIESVKGQKGDGLPNAAAIIPARNGKPALIAFVVTRFLENNRGQYRLLITTASSPMKTVNEFDLSWSGGRRRPAIAVSPDGQRVAIAGSEHKEIEVYQTDDILIKGRTPRPQRLKSLGLSFKSSGFVKNGDRWGLRFSELDHDAVGGIDPSALVFDIAERRVEPINADWSPATSEIAGWSVVDSASPGKVVVARQNMLDVELKLTDGFSWTGSAFSPPSQKCPFPLIAIASQMNGRPSLQLFNGLTGSHLRTYAAHTERIRSVTFSNDGRMLLTVADDRTACVWTTTDLLDRLGKHGTIIGVNLQLDRKPNVIVKKTPAGHTLKPDDEILAAIRQMEETPFNSVKEYYQYVRERKPGEVVEFKIRRGGKLENVRCEIGQEIDSARPLFTLFVAPSPKNTGEFEWIGWTPLGPFDIRGDRIDQWLGWHFNTGNPERPGDFAVIGQYRDLYSRRDLLQQLVEHQKLPPVPVPPADDPKVSFFLRHLDGSLARTDYNDIPQIDVNQLEVVASVTGVSSRKIRGVQLSINETESRNLDFHEGDSNWVVKLDNVKWKRGSNLLKMNLQTKDRDVSAVGRAEYHPARPTITWNPEKKWLKDFRETNATVEAMVTPVAEPIHVELLRQRPGIIDPELIEKWDSKEALSIKVNVPVFEGENQLEIVAWNASAPESHRSAETVRVPAFVRVAIPPMAPEIALKDVRVLSKGDSSKSLKVDPNSLDTYRSLGPEVEIVGDITGAAPIGRAAVVIDGVRESFAEFQANEVRQFPFKKTLTLKPGSQSIVVQAAVDDAKNEKRIVLIYEPQVPKISRMAATSEVIQELPNDIQPQENVFYSRYHAQSATISADFDGPLNDSDRVTLRVNEVPVDPGQITIDRQSQPQTITAKIPLIGGDNAVSLLVENDWTQKPVVRNLNLEFRRPPEITLLESKALLVDEPLEIRCRIGSVLPVRFAKIIIDGQNEFPSTPTEVNGDPGNYLLEAKGIGLETGTHTVEVIAANDEGTALVPVRSQVTVEQKKIEPPVIEIDSSLSAGFQSPTKQVKIDYTVRSSVPVRVQLKLRGIRKDEESVPFDQEIDDFEKDQKQRTILVDLFDGQNDIELIATSAGGFSKKETKISYTTWPANVDILSVDDRPPEWNSDGIGRFQGWSAPESRVQLRGRVSLKDGITSGGAMKARIWVNSLMQTTPIDDVKRFEDGAITGTFTAELTLTRSKNNEIRVEVYDDERRCPSSFEHYKRLYLDCQKHEHGQDLYLVLLGTGDSATLRENAKSVLRVKTDQANDDNGKWVSELFSSVRVIDALDRDATAVDGKFRRMIDEMKQRKRDRNFATGSHAIVMIYFQGKVHLTNDDFKFVTETGQSQKAPHFSGKSLETTLNETYGAHLLFLDLNQNDSVVTERDIWPRAPQLGIMISNWKGNNQQPPDTQLISALQRVLPENRIVRQLVSKLDASYAEKRGEFPGNIETKLDLLNDLKDVRIGID